MMKIKLNRTIVIFILVIATVSGLLTSILTHYQTAPDFIEPTRVFHHPLTFVSHLKNDPAAAKKIFHEYCATCHKNNAIISVNAPRIGYKSDWEPFKKMTLQQLFELAAKGYGAMPARGGCFECTDEQLKATIRFMLKHSQ